MANVRLLNTNNHRVESGGYRLGAGEMTGTIDDASAQAVALDAISGVRPATEPEATAYDADTSRGTYDPDFTPSGGAAPDFTRPVRDGVETAVQADLGPTEGFIHGPLKPSVDCTLEELANRAVLEGVDPATIDGADRAALLAAVDGPAPIEYPV